MKFYWNLFDEFSSRRQYSGMGEPMPIPISDFHTYAVIYQFSKLDMQISWSYIKFLDSLWLGEWRKRQPAKP